MMLEDLRDKSVIFTDEAYISQQVIVCVCACVYDKV